VPDLTTDGQWLEAPLWMWTAQQAQRRRVFVCRRGGEHVVSDRAGRELRLPIRQDGDATDAVERMLEWCRQGVKIRSRALITTLWARLALSDLFLHGIGGAKYDQVTDRLIEEFFGCPAPGILVLSATLYLPTRCAGTPPRPEAPQAELAKIRRQLRELSYHPEKYLRESGTLENIPAAAALAVEKQHWIYLPVANDNAYTRWKAMQRINGQLQPWVAARRQQLLDQQTEMQRALRHDKVLGSREYGFCLFPENYLQEFLGDLLPKRA
jgi:hypothetical protein